MVVNLSTSDLTKLIRLLQREIRKLEVQRELPHRVERRSRALSSGGEDMNLEDITARKRLLLKLERAQADTPVGT